MKKNLLFLGLLLLIGFSAFGLSDWDANETYDYGDDVVYNGTIYRAKWWNFNESPKGADWDVWQEIGPVYDYSDNLPPSKNPPGGLTPDETPMFIVLSFDDNFVPAGMEWLLDEVKNRKNPDGSDLKLTFYQPASSMWLTETVALWKRAMNEGHEVANHTLSHGEGEGYTLEQWDAEIMGVNDILNEKFPNGIGAYESEITGLRAPYLQYNDATFKALKKNYMYIDSSIEGGWNPEEVGTNNYWPYTMNYGSPDHMVFELFGLKGPIDPAPGMWELPIHALIVPTDQECIELGISPGLRDRCAVKTPWFVYPGNYKITGLDWNIRYEYELTGEEYAALLKYNLDLRLQGNKAPFIYAGHSNYYNDPENQAALADFIEYALSIPQVRFVTANQMVEWMRNPSPFDAE